MYRLKLLTIALLYCFIIKSQAENDNQHLLQLFKLGYFEYAFQNLKINATTTNDTWAQFYLGQCYEKGYGVIINKTLAFKFYRKTAEKGLAVGQVALAECYKKGIGVQCDNEKAVYWLSKAQGKYTQEQLSYLDILYQQGKKYPNNYTINPYDNNEYLANNINQTINNVTIVQNSIAQSSESLKSRLISDVDVGIPICVQNNELIFAFIIANENYQEVSSVAYALNDGEIFAEYCKKCLGLPSSNVRLIKDATLNNIKREINQINLIAEAYKGKAKFIFYYVGHGIPNEATKNAYLLPIDGYGTDVTTAYSLDELYSTLGSLNSEQIVVLLDACFSGTQRGEGMLASARGVAIKAKQNSPSGKMVVLSAAQGDETAYPYEEQGHGLFTYYLLKSLKESNGSVSLGELSAYIKDNVSKKSIVINGKSQTPSVSASSVLGESWRNWTLK